MDSIYLSAALMEHRPNPLQAMGETSGVVIRNPDMDVEHFKRKSTSDVLVHRVTPPKYKVSMSGRWEKTIM